MAQSHACCSPYRSGEPGVLYEHAGSSSPEGSSTENETYSDTTLDDVDELDERLSHRPYAVTNRASYTSSQSLGADICPWTIFPFHLISGCSSAGRTMCSPSRSMTSQEVRRVLGLRGMYIHIYIYKVGGALVAPQTAHLGAGGPWINCAVIAPTPNWRRVLYTRPCRNTGSTLRSQADNVNSSTSA
jgi:hypothetical protein